MEPQGRQRCTLRGAHEARMERHPARGLAWLRGVLEHQRGGIASLQKVLSAAWMFAPIGTDRARRPRGSARSASMPAACSPAASSRAKYWLSSVKPRSDKGRAVRLADAILRARLRGGACGLAPATDRCPNLVLQPRFCVAPGGRVALLAPLKLPPQVSRRRSAVAVVDEVRSGDAIPAPWHCGCECSGRCSALGAGRENSLMIERLSICGTGQG